MNTPTWTKMKLDGADMRRICTTAAEYLESGWCQGAAARDADDCATDNPASPNAVAWCFTGAIHRAVIDLRGPCGDLLGLDVRLAVGEIAREVLIRAGVVDASWCGPGTFASSFAGAGEWNDRAYRVVGDVTSPLRRAADTFN